MAPKGDVGRDIDIDPDRLVSIDPGQSAGDTQGHVPHRDGDAKRAASASQEKVNIASAICWVCTPDSAASAAVEAADLVLIPCRPSAFDLAAIKTTASLVKMRGKPAFVIFTAGSPTAPRMYDEAAQLVQDYGLDACPHHIADRAAFRHAAAEGKTAMEIEPSGKAADEVRQLYKWTCEHVNMQASRKRRANA